MKPNTWTTEEISFLKMNYPKYGVNFCIDKLGYSKSKIQNKTYELNIKLEPKTKTIILSKPTNKCNINPDLFYNITNKEIAYLLGLIWADGFLNPSKNGKNSNLGFTMVKEDIDVIKPVLESIGKWNYYGRKQPVKTWRPSINVITNNKRIFNFLIEYDYDKKSYVSADKILSKIPDDLKHYFFRGLIDGDGCFYHYTPKKGSILRQFALTSTYEQNWSYFEGLCNELDIKYKIKRTINTKSSSSVIRITNKDGINKLGTYIYKDFDIDNVGLKRKYNKFKEIIS
jgi:hypothetical protein